MSLIPFPNVPDVSGVPAVPRSSAFPAVAQIGLGVLQGMLWRIFQVQTRWGVWDSAGKPLGDPAAFTGLVGNALDAAGLGSTLSTDSVEYSKETKISDFPLERGSFASYNKVELPANPSVTLCMMGTESDRASFLTAIDTACKSTGLYSVVTPEVTYANHSIERYSYQRRSSKGCTLLIVELSLKEIREVSATYSTSQIKAPQNSAAAPSVDAGKVQAQTPPTSTLKSLAAKLPGLANTANQYIQGVLP